MKDHFNIILKYKNSVLRAQLKLKSGIFRSNPPNFVSHNDRMWHLISWLVPSPLSSVWELHILPLSQSEQARKTCENLWM